MNKFQKAIFYEQIKTVEDIIDCRNNMCKEGKYTGNIPLSISDCEVVGINGDCGKECPIFKSGKCESEGK